MKELSIEEKAKRYDEAIEKGKQIQNTPYTDHLYIMKEVTEHLFPELKESDDEKIIHWIRKELEAKYVTDNIVNNVMADKAFGWLRKQGEDKPADKIEPKFKVGDWVTNGLDFTFQVRSIEDNMYLRSDDYFIDIETADKTFRLWTIQDAKDGDVLACNEEILLFKLYSEQERISLYCWYNGQTNNFHSKEVNDTLLTTRNKICPATKEQRDLLFQKMKEAGYEWDAEKKELKKISQEYPLTPDECIKPTWSEEDEKMIRGLITICDEWAVRYSYYPVENCDIEMSKNWLKSLKDRYVWKPSEKQMNTLEQWLQDNRYNGDVRYCYPIFDSLYQDLKKLMEE